MLKKTTILIVFQVFICSWVSSAEVNPEEPQINAIQDCICSICKGRILAPFVSGDCREENKCLFHKACLAAWFNGDQKNEMPPHGECPSCQVDVSAQNKEVLNQLAPQDFNVLSEHPDVRGYGNLPWVTYEEKENKNKLAVNNVPVNSLEGLEKCFPNITNLNLINTDIRELSEL